MMVGSSEGDGRHPYVRYVKRHGPDGPEAEYLSTLRVANCPGCGRLQYTVEGKPVMCPKCVAPAKVIAHPTAPMRMKTRRGRRV